MGGLDCGRDTELIVNIYVNIKFITKHMTGLSRRRVLAPTPPYRGEPVKQPGYYIPFRLLLAVDTDLVLRCVLRFATAVCVVLLSIKTLAVCICNARAHRSMLPFAVLACSISNAAVDWRRR